MDEKYLIVKGCAGIGNRLITLCSAIEYSKLTKRKLIVDWSDGLYGVPGENVFFKYFAIVENNYLPIEDAEKLSSLRGTIFPNGFAEKLNFCLYDLYKQVSFNFKIRIPYTHYSFLRINMLKSFWALKSESKVQNIYKNLPLYLKLLASPSSFPLAGNLPKKLNEDIVIFADYLPPFINENLQFIKLKGPVWNFVNEFSGEHHLDQAIGVHVRSTDMKPKREISVLIEKLINGYEDKIIFLSTDSQSVYNQFKVSFKNLIIYNKFNPELKNNEGLHQWASNNSKPDYAEMIFRDSIIDMYLLSRCETLYFQGNSSFSIISQSLHPNNNNCFNWQV